MQIYRMGFIMCLTRNKVLVIKSVHYALLITLAFPAGSYRFSFILLDKLFYGGIR